MRCCQIVDENCLRAYTAYVRAPAESRKRLHTRKAQMFRQICDSKSEAHPVGGTYLQATIYSNTNRLTAHIAEIW